MANDPSGPRPPRAPEDKSQRKIDDITGMLGSGRGMWMMGALGLIGTIALIMVVVDQFR